MEEGRLTRIEKKLDEIAETGIKKKKFKLPIKGKVNKKKLKEGYATIMIIEDNKSIDFTKEKIEGSTIKLKDTYHATNGEEILNYKGKPLLIQTKKSINPINVFDGNKDETYGHKYVIARMKGDLISAKKKMGWGIGIIIVIVIGVVIYAVFTGG